MFHCQKYWCIFWGVKEQWKSTEYRTTEDSNEYKVKQNDMTNQEIMNNKNKNENNLDKTQEILNIILSHREGYFRIIL